MNASFEEAFGRNLRELRRRAGLTQEEVTARLQVLGCDVTRSALAKMEVGQRHVYPDEIRFLKDVLKTTYDELFLEKR